MKKLFLLILLLNLCLCSCQKLQEKTPASLTDSDIEQEKILESLILDEIENVTIKVLPSPPKMKTIDKEEDIKDIIEHINSIKKQKKDFENINGWSILIQIYGKQEHSISFCGSIMTIDDVQYTIDSGEVGKIKTLYSDLAYAETNVIP